MTHYVQHSSPERVPGSLSPALMHYVEKNADAILSNPEKPWWIHDSMGSAALVDSLSSHEGRLSLPAPQKECFEDSFFNREDDFSIMYDMQKVVVALALASTNSRQVQYSQSIETSQFSIRMAPHVRLFIIQNGQNQANATREDSRKSLESGIGLIGASVIGAGLGYKKWQGEMLDKAGPKVALREAEGAGANGAARAAGGAAGAAEDLAARAQSDAAAAAVRPAAAAGAPAASRAASAAASPVASAEGDAAAVAARPAAPAHAPPGAHRAAAEAAGGLGLHPPVPAPAPAALRPAAPAPAAASPAPAAPAPAAPAAAPAPGRLRRAADKGIEGGKSTLQKYSQAIGHIFQTMQVTQMTIEGFSRVGIDQRHDSNKAEYQEKASAREADSTATRSYQDFYATTSRNAMEATQNSDHNVESVITSFGRVSETLTNVQIALFQKV